MQKRIILVALLLAAVGQACAGVTVNTDEEFSVQEVVSRLDEHMANVLSWYATAKRSATVSDSAYVVKEKIVRMHAFDMGLLKSAVEVTHSVMVACFADMEEQQSLDPFFKVWKEFKCSYVQSKDHQLLCKEIAFLAMHLYSTMLGQLQRSGTRVNVSQMLELYHIIAALPIYELLALLDSIAREIIGLLDQTYHGETSFFVWLWHNWWVPPTVISHALGSLVEGIANIMIPDKPVEADPEKEDAQKSSMLRAMQH